MGQNIRDFKNEQDDNPLQEKKKTNKQNETIY